MGRWQQDILEVQTDKTNDVVNLRKILTQIAWFNSSFLNILFIYYYFFGKETSFNFIVFVFFFCSQCLWLFDSFSHVFLMENSHISVYMCEQNLMVEPMQIGSSCLLLISNPFSLLFQYLECFLIRHAFFWSTYYT